MWGGWVWSICLRWVWARAIVIACSWTRYPSRCWRYRHSSLGPWTGGICSSWLVWALCTWIPSGSTLRTSVKCTRCYWMPIHNGISLLRRLFVRSYRLLSSSRGHWVGALTCRRLSSSTILSFGRGVGRRVSCFWWIATCGSFLTICVLTHFGSIPHLWSIS